MLEVILWIGFLGGWLLFAGPIYQAALELQEQEIDRERILAVSSGVPAPRLSPWWWLLPPVAFLIRLKQNGRYREEVFSRLSRADARAFVAFVDRAAGWLLVGVGALFIATKETWELVEHNEWPPWAFWSLWILMGAIAVAYTTGRMLRSRRFLETTTAADPTAAEPTTADPTTADSRPTEDESPRRRPDRAPRR